MKKKYPVIIIAVLIIVAISIFFLYQRYVEEARKYEIEKIENPQYFILKEDTGYGVINKNGDILVETKYNNVIIPNPEKAVFVCYEEENTKVYNDLKEQIFTEFENINPLKLKNIASNYMYEKSVLTYTKDEKVGLINLEGKVLTKPIYDEITALSYKEGELLVKLEEKYGVINIKGNDLVESIYDQITVDNYYEPENSYLYAGYIVGIKTQEGYRYGYVDIKGKEILPTEFNEIYRITEIKNSKEIYLVSAKNGQYGLYKNSEQILPNEYLSVRYDRTNNIVVVQKGKEYGVIGLNGENIIPIEYKQIDITGKNIYAKKDDTEIRVFDKEGNTLESSSDIAILQTENQGYFIKIDSTQGTVYSIVNNEGLTLTKEKYSYLSYLYDDYFIASISDGKLGLIDISEKQKIQIKYDSIEEIQNTKMLKTAIIDDNTTQIFSSKLEQVCEMSNAKIEIFGNYIKVYNEEETRYFDLDGNEKNSMEILSGNNIFANKKDGKWGYVDKSGIVKIDYIYDKATNINEYGFGAIKKDGKWGVIDNTGNIVLEPTYEIDSITNKEPEFIKEYYKVEYGFGEYYFTK